MPVIEMAGFDSSCPACYTGPKKIGHFRAGEAETKGGNTDIFLHAKV